MNAQDAYLSALEILDSANSVLELRNAARKIHQFIEQMPDEYAQILRAFYHTKYDELESKIKPVDLNGKLVVVNKTEEVQTRFGPSLILEGSFEGSGEPFRCWCPGTNEGRVAKFYRSLNPEEFPVRVIHHKIPHPTNHAKMMWILHRLPSDHSRIREDVPF